MVLGIVPGFAARPREQRRAVPAVTPVTAEPAQRGTPSVLELPGASERLRVRLADGLAAVNALIAARVDHDDPFVAEAGSHLIDAGGKRFRPLLVLLAAEPGDGIDERVVAAAAVVELTHLASLYHDDVMDEADLRRGAPSANAALGQPTAILTGDFLFARPPRSSPTSGREAVRIQAQTFARLCSGQIRETGPPGPAPTRSTTTSACSPTRPAR